MFEEIIVCVCMQQTYSEGLLGWAVLETRLTAWLETIDRCVATDP